jgi:hypothetical protein
MNPFRRDLERQDQLLMNSAGRTSVHFLSLGLVLCLLGGCNARKRYPDAAPGWHSKDFSIIFGRLQRVVPAAPPGDSNAAPAPIWTIRFGSSQEIYGGELALTPAEQLVGYTGGETVEVRGHLLTQTTNDAYSGRWFVVESIRMWYGQH